MNFWDIQCICCESVLGDNIGGYFMGHKGSQRIAVCDWCLSCMSGEAQ